MDFTWALYKQRAPMHKNTPAIPNFSHFPVSSKKYEPIEMRDIARKVTPAFFHIGFLLVFIFGAVLTKVNVLLV